MANRRMRQEKYQPFGDLFLEFPGHVSASEYRRELDIDRAVASVQYKSGGVTFRREVFASHPDNVIVMRITADQPGKLNFKARLATPHEVDARHRMAVESVTIDGGQGDRAVLVMRGKVHDGDTRFEARLIVQLEGEQKQVRGTAMDDHSFGGADAATLLLVGASSFVNYQDISGDPAASNDRTDRAA